MQCNKLQQIELLHSVNVTFWYCYILKQLHCKFYIYMKEKKVLNYSRKLLVRDGKNEFV